MASTDSEIGKFVAARPTCEAYSGTGAVINHFSANLGNDWKRLGRKLQLSKTDLDGIEVANPQVLEDQISDLFHLWKKRNGRHATAEALIAAAQSAGLDDLITTGTNYILQCKLARMLLVCTCSARSEPGACE